MNKLEFSNDQLRLLIDILKYAKQVGYIDFVKYESEDVGYDSDFLKSLTSEDIETILQICYANASTK